MVTGNDSNNGTSAATPWLTISHVNARTFNPGDSVLFQTGCTWREQLTAPSSGASGSPITFSYYGTGASLPRITGANIQSSWTFESGIFYYAPAYASNPGTVSNNGALLYQMAAKANVVNATQWWYDSTDKRVYIGFNPSGNTVEIGTRSMAVTSNGSSYVTFDHLWMESGTAQTAFASSGLTNVAFSNNLVKNAVSGIATSSTVGSNGQILNNTIYNTNGVGIIVGNGNIAGWMISGNSVSYAGYADPSGGTQCSGIYVSVGTGTGNIIQNNDTFNNGLGPGNPSNVECHGIYLDSNPGGTQVTIQYNKAHDNFGAGIQVHSSNAVVAYNLVYGNAMGILVEHSPIGVHIYNNTIASNYHSGDTGADAGLCLQDNGTTVSALNNNIFYGNYYIANSSTLYNRQIYVTTGSPNPSITASDNNLFYGSDAAGEILVDYQGTGYTFATWKGLGFDAHGVSADPKFTKPGSGDFTLQSGSPAVDAGTNLGATYQFGLDPRTSFPWGTLNQNSQGSGWEIGAFVFVQQIPPAPPTSLSVTVN